MQIKFKDFMISESEHDDETIWITKIDDGEGGSFSKDHCSSGKEKF